MAAKKDGTILGLRAKVWANLGAYLSTASTGHPDDPPRPDALGRLRHPEHPRGRLRRLHEHDADRRLPRRRPARGDVHGRAARGPARRRSSRWIRPRSARRTSSRRSRTATPSRPASTYDSGNYVGALRQGAEDGSTTRASGSSRPSCARRASTSASASAPTPRSAASDPRRSRARSASAAASGRAPSCASIPPARSTSWSASRRTGRARRRRSRRSSRASSASRWTTSRSSHGDTERTPMGWGSYGSRSTPVGSGALMGAIAKIKEKAKIVTAHLLEAAVEDIDYADGKFFVKGSPGKFKTIQDVALMANVAWNYPEGPRARPRGVGVLRSAQLRLSLRRAHRRRASGRRDRRGPARALRRRRRLRPRHQPDDRRGADPRRHRAGHRPGALGRRRLRRERPAR